MRIAVFTDLYLDIFGGIPSSIRAQKHELERLGHSVTVFCPGTQTDEENVVLLPTPKWLKVGGAPMAVAPKEIEKWFLKKYPDFGDKFDVVHIHYEAEVSVAGLRLARKFNLPVVQTMHGREDVAVAVNVPHPFKTVVGTAIHSAHGLYMGKGSEVEMDNYLAPTVAQARMWSLMVKQANAADIVITPTRHFAKKLEYYGVEKKIVTISNGVPDRVIAENWPVRKFSGGEPLRLIWASRVSHEKRIIPFLMALSLLPEESWVFDVYGDGNDLRRVRRIVKGTKMKKWVRIHGAVSHKELLEAMRKADLSIMASYGFDTQGMVLLEAEATGLPVFYCDPDMREVVPRSGSVIAKGAEPEKMAMALMEVLENPGRIEEMSRVMLERRGEVSQSAQIKKLLKVYDQLSSVKE